MSECVVRMEMPKNCDECPMCGTASGGNGMYKLWCMCGDIPASAHRIPGDCPIICSLPEGHGRLGDLDELKNWLVAQTEYYKRFDYGAICNTMVSAYETVCKVIDSMTVIVPAERSET